VLTYAFHGGTLASEIVLPELPRSTRRSANCLVHRGTVSLDCPPEWFHAWRLDGRTHLAFGRHAGGYLLRVPRMADFLVSSDGGRVECHPRRRLPAATLRHFLLDQVLPLALSRTGRLVMHASAVHVPGVGAVAFAGRAGRGKSTIAAALARDGCPLVSDDCLVVQPDPASGVPRVQSAYPGVRLWRDAARALGESRDSGRAVAHYTSKRRVDRLNRRHLAFRAGPSRLRVLYVLAPRHRGGAPCRIRPQAARDTFVALTRCLYVLDVTDARQLDVAFRRVAWLADEIPIRSLSVVDDPGRLDDVADAIRRAAIESAHAAAP
jgi:hypothetical protein